MQKISATALLPGETSVSCRSSTRDAAFQPRNQVRPEGVVREVFREVKCKLIFFCVCESKKLTCFSAPGTQDGVDSASLCSSSSGSSRTCTPRLVPGHRMWADRNGRHVLGLIEDYDALRKHISEGQQVLAHMEAALRESTKLQEPGVKVSTEILRRRVGFTRRRRMVRREELIE